MPWNWDGRRRKSVEHGGSVGTVSEANTARSWPSYDAAYLAKRLGSQFPDAAYTDKYKGGHDRDGVVRDVTYGMDAEQKSAYLSRVTANYRSEADECLKAEFMQWLEGAHDDNYAMRPYVNGDGKPARRFVYRDQSGKGGGAGSGVPGDTLEEWRPTWWGKSSLTFLDGARDFLRENKINSDQHSLALNLLAEHGPQDIEQAWSYFKHWVKGRPLSEAECIHLRAPEVKADPNTQVSRAPFGPVQPDRLFAPPAPPKIVPITEAPTEQMPMGLPVDALRDKIEVEVADRRDSLYPTGDLSSAVGSGMNAYTDAYINTGGAILGGLVSSLEDLIKSYQRPAQPSEETPAEFNLRRPPTPEPIEEQRRWLTDEEARITLLEQAGNNLEVLETLRDSSSGEDRLRLQEDIEMVTGQAQALLMNSDPDTVNDLADRGVSGFRKVLQVFTPGPLMRAQAGRTARAVGRAAGTSALVTLEGTANLVTAALTPKQQETSEEYSLEYNFTRDEVEDLQTIEGMRALGFKPSTERRLAIS